jgi:hypothetical protein
MGDDLVSYAAIVLEDIVVPGVGCLSNLFSNGLFRLLAQFKVNKIRRGHHQDSAGILSGFELGRLNYPQGTQIVIDI